MRCRYRILLWLDGAGNPLQAAVGTYANDELSEEITWTPEPFDTPHEVLERAIVRLTVHQQLW